MLFVARAVQHSSVQDGICVFRKAHMRSTPSLRSFPNVAFEMVPSAHLTDDDPLSSFHRRSSRASSFHASLLRAFSAVMSLALCPQVLPQAPQHFRSSEKQASCDGCFSCQSICLVVLLHSSMSRAVHAQGFWKVDVVEAE